MKTPYIIEATDVYVRYPVGKNGETKTVLNDIDLRIRKGEFVSLVGPTGCGKSTFFRQLLGSEKPTSGTILIDGEPINGVSRDRGIVFQRYNLYRDLSVLDNITFGLELEQFGPVRRRIERIFRMKTQRSFREEAFEYIKHIGFTKEDAMKYPRQLSGGMQQRVAIAQALIMKPKILLMDEPFGALDDDTRTRMQILIHDLHRKFGMTILFVTHSLEEALFLGTRIILLSQYYSSDNSHDPGTQGSKIVLDKAVPPAKPSSDDLKYQPEFSALMQEIRHDGLDPENLQHVKTFDLSHPDAYRTVTKEEWGGQ